MSDDLSPPDAGTIGDDLLILFPRNGRPTMRQVRAEVDIANAVDLLGPDLVRYEHKVDIAPPNGLALQHAGLMFDLVGLAPGPAIPIPDIGDGDALERASKRMASHASSLRLGPHIAAGARDLTVLRAWFGLAQAVASKFGASAICWVPGAVIIELERMAEALRAWDARGEVPVGLLASFRLTLDGALQSHGLSHFTGQEFRIEPALLRGDEHALARVLFAHLFFAGRQQDTGELAAPDGHTLRLEPSGNGRYVRVWPG